MVAKSLMAAMRIDGRVYGSSDRASCSTVFAFYTFCGYGLWAWLGRLWRVFSAFIGIFDFFPPAQHARFGVFLVFEKMGLAFFSIIMGFLGVDFLPVS
jgi:hypothetical protein